MAQLAECLQFKYKELNLTPRSHLIIQVPWLGLIAPVLERRDKRIPVVPWPGSRVS